MQADRIDSQAENQSDANKSTKPPLSWTQVWESLVRMGLGEVTLRVGTGLASLVLVLLVVWVMGNFYLKGQAAPGDQSALAAPLPTPTATFPAPQMVNSNQPNWAGGISRQTILHTFRPQRPRFDVVQYLVQKGDTVIGIAQKYGLKPETILWGNYYILADNPDRLAPGQKLNILPVDGIYYQWHAGDGLNGVAKFYGVSTDDIVNWPGNHLDANSLGDYGHPNIKTGTWIMIPGCERDFITLSAPRITRANPAVAKIWAGLLQVKLRMARLVPGRSSGRLPRSTSPVMIIHRKPIIGASTLPGRQATRSTPPITAWWYTPAGMIGGMGMWWLSTMAMAGKLCMPI